MDDAIRASRRRLEGPHAWWSRPDGRVHAPSALVALALLVVIAAGGATSGGSVTPFLALLPLPFLIVGFTQPPGSSLALLPFAAIAIVFAAHGEWSRELVTTVVLTTSISVLAGEAIAQLMRRQRDSEVRVGRLLHAVRVLAREDDETEGAKVLAALAVEMLDADAAAVLLGNSNNARLFQHRGWFGHPALADAVPWVVDA